MLRDHFDEKRALLNKPNSRKTDHDNIVLVIHGGAGTMSKDRLSRAAELGGVGLCREWHALMYWVACHLSLGEISTVVRMRSGVMQWPFMNSWIQSLFQYLQVLLHPS